MQHHYGSIMLSSYLLKFPVKHLYYILDIPTVALPEPPYHFVLKYEATYIAIHLAIYQVTVESKFLQLYIILRNIKFRNDAQIDILEVKLGCDTNTQYIVTKLVDLIVYVHMWLIANYIGTYIIIMSLKFYTSITSYFVKYHAVSLLYCNKHYDSQWTQM